MPVKERYFNPFAKTIDEMYEPAPEDKTYVNFYPFGASDAKRPQPRTQQSFDSIVIELNSFRCEKSADLRNRLYSLKAEIAEFLADARANKIEALEPALDGAILAVRKAKKKLAEFEQEVFASHREFVRLEGAAENASRRLGDLQYEVSRVNSALLTKAEKAVLQQKVATAQRKAEDATLTASHAQTSHNQLVAKERELLNAHMEAVNAAENINREIDRLCK